MEEVSLMNQRSIFKMKWLKVESIGSGSISLQREAIMVLLEWILMQMTILKSHPQNKALDLDHFKEVNNQK